MDTSDTNPTDVAVDAEEVVVEEQEATETPEETPAAEEVAADTE
jgi:hypothetical protein